MFIREHMGCSDKIDSAVFCQCDPGCSADSELLRPGHNLTLSVWSGRLGVCGHVYLKVFKYF